MNQALKEKKENKKHTYDEISFVYELPLLELIYRSHTVHLENQPKNKVQLCTLSNIKSGYCPEDCKYCPQSSRYNTDIEKYNLLSNEEIISEAKNAKDHGASRFCMGAAWRNAPDNEEFEKILNVVKEVSKLNLEVCCTLGMLTKNQAERLKDAGLTAYNHNLDTSKDFYSEIITTRTYEDRLNTIKNVSDAGIQVCCGGILGLGEKRADRIKLIQTLSNLSPKPESVPINALVKVKGTPLEGQEDIEKFEIIRTIATSRIFIPNAKVRLSAGRLEMSEEMQALCFFSGANSIFTGEKLLTTDNPSFENDMKLFEKLGLEKM